MNHSVLLRQLSRAGTAQRAVWLSGHPVGEASADIPAVTTSGIVELPEGSLFVEQFSLRPVLTIFGGGHISEPLVTLGHLLGFFVQVIDDRPEFAAPERFPEADAVYCRSFDHCADLLPTSPNAYFIIVTRGHLADQTCAELVLRRPFVYAGMIGSKKKVAISRQKLAEAGFSAQTIARLHAPVGLPIGAQTPEEISVSIAAELIQEKYAHGVDFLPERLIAALKQPRAGDILLTIVQKSGSAPRSVGSKMLVHRDGTQVGTIGGGNGEYAAAQDALTCTAPMVKTYSMLPGSELGMVCGGVVTVLFEPVEGSWDS